MASGSPRSSFSRSWIPPHVTATACEPAAFLPQLDQHIVHPLAAGEVVVKRLVVRAVDADELVDAVGRELEHLRLETGPSDRGHQLLGGRLDAQHLAGGVPHRGEDDRAGVDNRAVEVEENDWKPHAADASRGPRRRAACRRDMSVASACAETDTHL